MNVNAQHILRSLPYLGYLCRSSPATVRRTMKTMFPTVPSDSQLPSGTRLRLVLGRTGCIWPLPGRVWLVTWDRDITHNSNNYYTHIVHVGPFIAYFLCWPLWCIDMHWCLWTNLWEVWIAWFMKVELAGQVSWVVCYDPCRIQPTPGWHSCKW